MNPNDPGYNPPSDWFVDAPGGETNLDSLFPDPNGDGQQPAPPSGQPPQTPPQEQFFLKTPTGTVYKTPEDAVTGITHKDTLIERLREYAIQQTGFDPVSNKQVRTATPPRAQTPPPADPSEAVVYSQNPQRYWDDLLNAANHGDAASYQKIQAQLVQEQLAPYAPLIATLARTAAIDSVASTYPKFKEFYNSEDYRKTLDSIPRLREAIQYAESSPQHSEQLGDLYKTAFLAAQGLRLAAPPPANPPVVQPEGVQQVRSTFTSGQMAPPNQMAPQARPSLNSSEGRQAIIQDQIAKGVLDLPM